MNPTNAQLQEMINDLPENIQKAIHEFDWANEVMNIGRAHQLQIDDIEIFRLQTLLVMLGHLPASTYEQNLASKLSVSREVAASLVDEANHQIFSELQRRAFRRDEAEEEPAPSPTWKASEDYLEPIEHEDLAGIMRNEGIELIAPDTDTLVDSELNNEVSQILGTIQSGKENTTNSSPLRAVGFDTEESHEQSSRPSAYQEPIEAEDLKGVKTQNIDTSILKHSSQVSPEKIFDDGVTHPERDLGQKKILDQSLDQHLMDNPFLAKGDTIDASPSEAESIKEEKGFLKHLAE